MSPADLLANERSSAKPKQLPSSEIERDRPTKPPSIAVSATTNTELQVRLDLIDGSILVGRPLVLELPVQTSFATMKIRLSAIESVEFTKTNKNTKLKLKNGDMLQGLIALPSLRLDTCIGRVEVRQDYLARLRVKSSITAEELHVRCFIDGTDEVHVRGNRLWYVHRSWKKPGDGDESQEQTFVNSTAWTPAWQGNISDKFGQLNMALPDQGDYQISMKVVRSRSQVELIQEPKEGNRY